MSYHKRCVVNNSQVNHAYTNIAKPKNVLDIQIIPGLTHNAWVECYRNTYDEDAQKGVAEYNADVESLKSKQILQEKNEQLKLFKNKVCKRVVQLQKLKKQEEVLHKMKLLEDEHQIVVQRMLGTNVPYKGSVENLQKLNKALLKSCIIPSCERNSTAMSLEEIKKSNNLLEEISSEINRCTIKAKLDLLSKKVHDKMTRRLWSDEQEKTNKEESVENYPDKNHLMDTSAHDMWSGIDAIGPSDHTKHETLDTNETNPAKDMCYLETLPGSQDNIEKSIQMEEALLQLGAFQQNLVHDEINWGKYAEEERLLKQNQYWKYRKIFMDIERDEVREKKRRNEHRKQIDRLKLKKEHDRKLAEERITHFRNGLIKSKPTENTAGTSCSSIKKTGGKKDKELLRYIEALRDVAQKRIEISGVKIPPLCSCGTSIWDAHPDTCANNCIFYRNPKEYVNALTTALKNYR